MHNPKSSQGLIFCGYNFFRHVQLPGKVGASRLGLELVISVWHGNRSWEESHYFSEPDRQCHGLDVCPDGITRD